MVLLIQLWIVKEKGERKIMRCPLSFGVSTFAACSLVGEGSAFGNLTCNSTESIIITVSRFLGSLIHEDGEWRLLFPVVRIKGVQHKVEPFEKYV
jgi:hypothetical protein